MNDRPYFLAVQMNSSQTVEACGVPIPVWSSGAFRTTIQAAEAVAVYCGHDPETVERLGFALLEICPAPK